MERVHHRWSPLARPALIASPSPSTRCAPPPALVVAAYPTGLRLFIEDFDLQQFGINPGDRVGIALPNGPELGILLLSVCARACACPVNPQSTAGEIVQDLGEVNTKCLIVLAGDNTEHLEEAAATMGVQVLTVIPSDSECGIFSLVSATGVSASRGAGNVAPGSVMTMKPGISTDTFKQSAWTAPDQHALVLHTSGTSGKKKIVPYSLRTMVVGSACIVKSWMLTQDDINLNMMPLFHIGGIARNVFSPVLSGGGVVLCPGFDPSLFWVSDVHRP